MLLRDCVRVGVVVVVDVVVDFSIADNPLGDSAIRNMFEEFDLNTRASRGMRKLDIRLGDFVVVVVLLLLLLSLWCYC